MHRRLLAVYAGLLALLACAAAAGGVLVFRDLSSGDPISAVANRHAYDLMGWELRYFPQKWLYKLATVFDGGPASGGEGDALLRRYFALATEIGRLEQQGDGAGRLAEVRREREEIENDVEQTLESRISDFLRDQGLAMNPPLFSDIGLLFPPVDFELDRPPKVLAISPRDRISLDRDYLLEPGLGPDAVTAIEMEAEAAGVSAIVVDTGGIATYPSIIPELAPFSEMLETAIHEWLHQYLAFYPLGSSYFGDENTRTLNETVANMAGRELAGLFTRRYGSPEPQETPPLAPPDGFDFRKAMRALRLRVEELLADGRVKEAERLMDERRAEFESEGYYIRRINQAYFAFHGSYADTPGSIDPIGPKLQGLRDRAGSAAQFLRLARSLSSETDLDRLLAGS